jgi:hypothetical protein
MAHRTYFALAWEQPLQICDPASEEEDEQGECAHNYYWVEISVSVNELYSREGQIIRRLQHGTHARQGYCV